VEGLPRLDANTMDLEGELFQPTRRFQGQDLTMENHGKPEN